MTSCKVKKNIYTKVQHYLISKMTLFQLYNDEWSPMFSIKKIKINRTVRYRGRNVCSVCRVIREWNSITERAFVAICAIFKCNWRCKYRWSARCDNKKLFYFYFSTKLCMRRRVKWRYVNFYYDGLFATITKKNLEHFLVIFWRRWNGDKNQFSDTWDNH